MMVFSLSPAENGRAAVIYLLGWDGLMHCRPVDPGMISDSITIAGRWMGRLRTLDPVDCTVNAVGGAGLSMLIDSTS
jgi:hypothetical protein